MAGRIIGIVLVVIAVIVFILVLQKLFSDGAPIPQPDTIKNICAQEIKTVENNLVENYIDRLRLEDDSCDVELLCQHFIFRTHKVILAAHSKYFEETLQNLDKSSNRIEINDVDHKTLQIILEYIYSGFLPSDYLSVDSNCYNLLQTADQFQLNSLKCEVSRYLQSKLCARNIGDIITLAEQTHSPQLQDAAANYLVENFKTIRDSNDWKLTVTSNKDILAKAFDVHGKLPTNSICNITCHRTTLKTNQIVENLDRFFSTGLFTDADIVVHNKNMTDIIISVNKAVLIGQSDVFSRQYSDSKMFDRINNVSKAGVREFLQYLYSGMVKAINNTEVTEELLYLSDLYEMKPLKLVCEDYIINHMNVQNAAKIVIVADRAKSKRISSKVLDFILQNIKEIVKTPGWIELKENNPELLTKIF